MNTNKYLTHEDKWGKKITNLNMTSFDYFVKYTNIIRTNLNE
jgi:hypothetical protein